jgi:putative membrane protein
MRKIIVSLLSTTASFYVAAYFLAGFKIDNTWSAYVIASLVFVIFNFFLSPIIKLLLLPINILTLGLFRWLTNVLVLYLFDLIYDGINIMAFTYPGYSSSVISIPSGDLNLFWVLVIASLLMSVTYSIIAMLVQTEE